MKKLSIIVPCFNEEEALPIFYKEINKISISMEKKCNFEYLFIDDGSTDDTLNVVKELSKKDKRVKYISFSRNFGKEAAMYSGLEKVTGDYIAIMDADLQDPPKLLEEMYNILEYEDYDTVATRRVTRKGEPKIRSFFARRFYKLINKMSKIELVDGARNFRLMKRQVVDAIISLKEYNRYANGIFSFVGFKTKWLEYENVKRVAGETKWSFWQLFKYAVNGIVAFTTVPLIISFILGFLFTIASSIMLIFLFINSVILNNNVSGVFTISSIVLFVSGIQLLCIGILGEYLSKNYLENKKRPIYIVKEDNLK